MAKVPENFMMQRRLNGMDVYQPAADIAPGDVTDSTNLYSYDGEFYSRWGKLACFTSPPSSSPCYGLTEFIRSDGSTVVVFVNAGKLYFTAVTNSAGVPLSAPLSYTEIKINGTTSFNLNSASVQMKIAGKYLYVVDGTVALTDLAVSGGNTHTVSSASHPFQTAGVGKQITITGGTNWTAGTYTINSVSGGVATLSSAIATSTTATGGQGTLAGPLYRVNVNADSSYTASVVTALQTPNAPSASLTNTIIDAMSSITNWHQFPALTWPGGVGVTGSSSGVGGPETIFNNGNQTFSGGSNSPSPHPQGWLSGGDSMGWYYNSTYGNQAYMDSGATAQWCDYDYPAPTYGGQNTINNARVWVASFTANGNSAIGVQLQLYAESAQTSGHTVSTTITAASSNTPIVITAAGHALTNGQYVAIAGVLGNTSANGNWYVSVLSTSTFALYQDYGLTIPVVGNGSYTSGGTVTVTAPTAYTDLAIPSGSTTTMTSSAHPFQSSDANKIITIFGGTGFNRGNYTITSVSGGVATVNGTVGTAGSSGGIGVLALDSGGSAANGNYTLQNPLGTNPSSVQLSGIAGGEQTAPLVKPTPNTQVYSYAFSYSGFGQDYDVIKYRLYDPAQQGGAAYLWNPSLKVVDVRLIPSISNKRMHLAANNPVGLGANCLGGVWIKRDYTGTTTSYTDLVIASSGASTSTVTSAGHPFSSANVGQVLVVTGGTGFTLGNYPILSVSGTTATVSGNIGTAASTGGSGTAYGVQDFSKSNLISIGYSAPTTTPQIPWRIGILKAGQPITSVIWSNLATYEADGSSLYIDISSIDVTDSYARAQCAYLFLMIDTDLPATINPADLCTIGPMTNAGNFSVGESDYNYVQVEAEDNSLTTGGVSTGNTADGVVLSNPSDPSSPSLTPTGYQAQALVQLAAPSNTVTNWLYVYRFGGALAGQNVTSYTSYILLDQCPVWSGTSTGQTAVSTGGVGGGSWTWNGTAWASSDGFRTWNPNTRVLTDDTPDLALIGNDFLQSGRGAPPMGASCLELWNNRLVLAQGSTLYISDLLTTNAAAALYYTPTVDPEDPYAVTKGGIYPVEPNDNDQIVQMKTHGQYLDVFKQKSVYLLTGQDPVSGFQITPHLKDAGIGIMGGPQAVCGFDLNVAFVGPTAVHEYKAEPVHVSFGMLQAYEDAEQAPVISLKIEPLLAPFIKGGSSISRSAYGQMVLRYYGRRLWLFAPSAGGSSNSVAYVYDTRPATDGSGPVGWTRLTNFNIVSCCSLGSQNDAASLYMGGTDGQLYLLTGNADVSYVSGATNASPILMTTSGAHGLSNGQSVVVSGILGNTAANGTWYAGSVTATTFTLYQDAALTQPVAGNGAYTSGGTVSVPVSWNLTSRGFMNEANDFRYFKSNRPTRAYYLISTGENAAVTFSVGVVGSTGGSGQAPNFALTYDINGAQTDVRFKVPPEIRGYGAVLLGVSGSTRSQSRITAIGVEDAKGAVRGSV